MPEPSRRDSTAQSYIPGIDGLRAVAVLSVLLYHLDGDLLPGGFTGVDVFFVISGYVVTRSLVASTTTDLRSFLLAFYARRIRRIYPALAFCVLTVGLVSTLLIPDSWLGGTIPKTGLMALLGFSNFVLADFDGDYFSPLAEYNPFTHTWSLGVEEQFYLLFPVILFPWIAARHRGKTSLRAASLVPLFLALSLHISWKQSTEAVAQAYYLLPSRFWELACGALLLRLHLRQRPPMEPWLAGGLVALGLTGVGAGFFIIGPESFPFPHALLPIGGSLLVLAGLGACARVPLAGMLLETRGFVSIGKLSYSLYLWHWPVFVIYRWTVGLETPVEKLTATALAVGMSMLSYHFVEQPFRRLPEGPPRSPQHVLKRGLAAAAVCYAVCAAGFAIQPLVSLSVTADKRVWQPLAWSVADSGDLPQAPDWSGRRLFVLGDSHAWAYDTLLQILRERHGLEVHRVSVGGCPVVELFEPVHAPCVERVEQEIRNIEEAAMPGDVVLLASLRMNRRSDQWAPIAEDEIDTRLRRFAEPANRAAVMAEADSIVGRLEGRGLTVVIDAPKPVFAAPSFRCSDWFNNMNPICEPGLSVDRAVLLQSREPVMGQLRELTREHPLVVVWDPFPTLCPTDPCTAMDPNTGYPRFRDGDHLSAHGNRLLLSEFMEVLETIWARPQVPDLPRIAPVGN
jgi:peptidoglycan/LPS O-acetylase OafA/YrhL